MYTCFKYIIYRKIFIPVQLNPFFKWAKCGCLGRHGSAIAWILWIYKQAGCFLEHPAVQVGVFYFCILQFEYLNSQLNFIKNYFFIVAASLTFFLFSLHVNIIETFVFLLFFNPVAVILNCPFLPCTGVTFT